MPKTMHFLFRFIVFFYLWGLFTAQRQKKEESTEEVKIEVLHRPENCSKTSKKGDLLNAHYDGYLAKDGSKFYCSRRQDSTGCYIDF
ncbi:FKBP7 isoform 6 [Pan troglodytes]|uniref:FKBP prolyl isomerase 7 n=2 Tax=Homininae TaxID=207598 RepID=F8WBF2_HUMAN|nr:FKBP prolyl isomerase 7 [Homo sapiens]KAI4037127.1 FKBP prolyl isomerase 7 [Homo sapiens]PNI86600.1 FKBP7 isoform 6 [Pan troglodytes]